MKTTSTSSLLANVELRICLRCSDDESAMILSTGNYAAAKLTKKGEAILNEDIGSKAGNRLMQIAFAGADIRETHASQIKNKTQEHEITSKPLVFDGARLPELLSVSAFSGLVSSSQTPQLLLGEELRYGSPRLVAELSPRQGAHLLCVGPDQVIQEGLICSTMLSVAVNESFQKLVYLNGHFERRRLHRNVQSLFDGERFQFWDAENEGLSLSDLPSLGEDRLGLLLVDGLDSAKLLHESGGTFRTKPVGTPVSVAEAFTELLSQNGKRRWYVVAIADDWKRLSRAVKQDVLASFRARIGFMLTEDDAGSVAYGNISRMKDSKQSNRAFFIDPRQAEPTWFKPFDSGGEHVG